MEDVRGGVRRSDLNAPDSRRGKEVWMIDVRVRVGYKVNEVPLLGDMGAWVG